MPNKDITDFLLTEYENVAKAFFNSYDIGARWVRYYLIILAVPFSFIAFIYHNKADQFDLFNLPASIAILIFVIGLLNILVSYIIVDLKLDSILYARTVNGIRKYFVEKILDVEELSPNKMQKYVLLPTDVNKPAFLEFGSGDLFFLTSFMVIINSIYFSLGLTQIRSFKNLYEPCVSQFTVFIIFLLLGVILQFAVFMNASKKKERDYCPRKQ
jgi:hypothetical protein